jgi:pimeloyl-ACP methyl ester carboxylesterase
MEWGLCALVKPISTTDTLIDGSRGVTVNDFSSPNPAGDGELRIGWNEVVLNGARQWVSVLGDRSRPVLLFLHGGPGGAEYGPRRHYLADLERTWCVVDWDQRGAGRSFHGDETAATLSLDTLVRDGITLVDRIRSQFPEQPIVLVGHSFGTVLGVLMALREPSKINAYVGASQVVNWALQEERSYLWALAEAERGGNRKAVAALSSIGRPEHGNYSGGTASVQVQRRWLGTLGGVSGDPRFLIRWMMRVLLAHDYPLGTKRRFTKGMARSMDLLWPELGEDVDFQRDVKSMAVPVHLFAGARDRITDLDQIERWYRVLSAPAKTLEIVEGVGHLNLFEAPERFIEYMSTVQASITGQPSTSMS